MKMSHDLYTALEAAIVARLAKTPDAWKRYKCVGLTPMRFRWDLLHASGFKSATLYDAGLNDTHIDTALRRICEPYMA